MKDESPRGSRFTWMYKSACAVEIPVKLLAQILSSFERLGHSDDVPLRIVPIFIYDDKL